MQKPCPRCKKMLRNMPQKNTGVQKKEIRGSQTNPVILRCTFCRKNYEFRGGKLNVIKRGG